MTGYSFCPAEQIDVPHTPDRRCPNDGTLVIPPSWGSHRQTWERGDWHPQKPRPEGYVYRTPACFLPEPAPRKPQPRPTIATTADVRFSGEKPVSATLKARVAGQRNRAARRFSGLAEATPQTVTCELCGETVPRKTHTPGSVQRFCSGKCRDRARQARVRDKRAERAAALPPLVCANCGTAFSRNGGRVSYCSEPCQRSVQSYRRPLLSDLGLRCGQCGRDDRQHKAHGLCKSCYSKRFEGNRRRAS